MNWNLFWGIYVGGFAIALWIVFYFLGLKKINKGNRCTSHTIGKIIRYSNVSYGGFHIPLVEYYVNGMQYKVVGPRFRHSSVITVSNPFNNVNSHFECNLTTRDKLPEVLKVKIWKNSFASITNSPLKNLYPIDSEVDVYYNPRKPKEAFVQRYEGYSKLLISVYLVLALLCTLLMFYFLFGPELVM